MKKRLICLMMAALFVMLLCGCNQHSDVSALPKEVISTEEQNYEEVSEDVVEEPAEESETVLEKEPQKTQYILNTNSKKFHDPDCSSVGQMKEYNKEYFTGDRETVIARGYVPCKKCKPQ